MTKRTNKVSEPQRTNEEIIEEIDALMKELDRHNYSNGSIDMYAFTVDTNGKTNHRIARVKYEDAIRYDLRNPRFEVYVDFEDYKKEGNNKVE